MLSQRDKTMEGAETPAKPRKSASAPKVQALKASEPAVAKKTVAPKKSTAAEPAKASAKAITKASTKAEIAQAPRIAQQDIAHEDVAKLAYLLWEARGMTGRAGTPEEDWVRAEALLRSGSTTVS